MSEFKQALFLPEKLVAILEALPKTALAFSGGVDSSFLLYAAQKCGVDLRPYYVASQFQPAFERSDAERLASELGIELSIIKVDVLSDETIVANPENRCYYCKRKIFSSILSMAKADACELIIDGSNASDLAEDRPGMKALAELAVRSPLREAGLNKADVRRYSRLAGLFTWNKPAYACLATRISSGDLIRGETLERVESAENALFKLGYHDFRIRVMGEAARIQLVEEEMLRFVRERSKIQTLLAPYFSELWLDLKARKSL